MKPRELIAEAWSGCQGLRKMQGLPAIKSLAMKGNQEAIKFLDSQGEQSAHHA